MLRATITIQGKTLYDLELALMNARETLVQNIVNETLDPVEDQDELMPDPRKIDVLN